MPLTRILFWVPVLPHPNALGCPSRSHFLLLLLASLKGKSWSPTLDQLLGQKLALFWSPQRYPWDRMTGRQCPTPVSEEGWATPLRECWLPYVSCPECLSGLTLSQPLRGSTRPWTTGLRTRAGLVGSQASPPTLAVSQLLHQAMLLRASGPWHSHFCCLECSSLAIYPGL